VAEEGAICAACQALMAEISAEIDARPALCWDCGCRPAPPRPLGGVEPRCAACEAAAVVRFEAHLDQLVGSDPALRKIMTGLIAEGWEFEGYEGEYLPVERATRAVG
jgi:hypothetical protein